MIVPYRKRIANDPQLHEISGATWLLTFSDLLTLLITLFVMRYAMTAVDSRRWEQLTSSVRTAMHGPADSFAPQHEQPLLLKLGKSLERQIPEHSDGITMTIRQYREAINIELAGSIFFGDTDELTFSGKERLSRIAATLKGEFLTVQVTAHSTLNPHTESKFASPWDLSAAWAGVTTRQMIDAGISPRVISAAGLADIQQDEDKELNKPSRRIELAISLPS